MIVSPNPANLNCEGLASEVVVAKPVIMQFIHSEADFLVIINSDTVILPPYANTAEISLPSINSGNIDILL